MDRLAFALAAVAIVGMLAWFAAEHNKKQLRRLKKGGSSVSAAAPTPATRPAPETAEAARIDAINEPLVVLFFREQCLGCREYDPMFNAAVDEVNAQRAERGEGPLAVERIDTRAERDVARDLARAWGLEIAVTPTVVVRAPGGEPLMYTGRLSRSATAAFLSSAL